MDVLLELSRNATTRALVKGLGLPLPQPPVLRRNREALGQRMLNDETVVVWSQKASVLQRAIADTLAACGARVVFSGAENAADSFKAPAEAWAEPLSLRSKPEPEERVYGLLLDASGFTAPSELAELFRAVQPWLRCLKSNGRVLVISRADGGAESEPSSAEQVATQTAVEGFTRSLAKEVGRKGVTANLLRVVPGAEGRLSAPLRFFLSSASAFITAQPLTVSVVARENPRADWERALHGRHCLVTGAARGIGAETARTLAREGARVLIVDHPSAESEASKLAAELKGAFVSLDLAAAEASEKLCDAVRAMGRLDVVVHNAGVTRDKTLARMTEEQWDMVLNVNLKAVTDSTRALLAQGLLNDNGRLVFLASVGGIAGNAGQTNYAASKAGLIGYARALARELAPRGITANAIAPGLIETKMTQAMPTFVREAARRLTALNQGGLPRDVAEAITFLALPQSDGVTGAVLRVCGGALIGA